MECSAVTRPESTEHASQIEAHLDCFIPRLWLCTEPKWWKYFDSHTTLKTLRVGDSVLNIRSGPEGFASTHSTWALWSTFLMFYISVVFVLLRSVCRTRVPSLTHTHSAVKSLVSLRRPSAGCWRGPRGHRTHTSAPLLTGSYSQTRALVGPSSLPHTRKSRLPPMQVHTH